MTVYYRRRTAEHCLLPTPGKITEITRLPAFGEKLQDRQATGPCRRPKPRIGRAVLQRSSSAKVLNTNRLD